MGNQVSSRNEVVIDTSTAVSIATNLIQENSTVITQTADRTNTYTFETAPGSKVKIGKLSSTQSIDATNQATGQINAEIISKLNTDIKSTLQAAADQAAEGRSGLFAIGDKVSTVNITRAKNALNVAIDTTITQPNWSSVVQSVVDTNNNKVYLAGEVEIDEVVNDQRLFSRLIAKSMIDTIISNANGVLASNNTDLRITQRATSSAGLFTGGAGMATSIISSLITLSICIVILIILFKLKKNSK